MKTRRIAIGVGLLGWAVVGSPLWANEQSIGQEIPTYRLVYRFSPGETVKWKVVHRAKVNTTVSGTTQTAETTSSSVKVWRVTHVDAERGHVTFEHSVESVDMRQQLTGREEVRYNSLTDAEPPVGFEDAAKAVGVTLAVVTIDGQGQVVKREQKGPQAGNADSQITIPLPAEPVPVGHTWTFPYDVEVSLKTGQFKTVKTRQRFSLEDVRDGVATIGIETQILTPISDPAVEAQLIQREVSGKVRFDLEQGRVLSQQTDLDKRVLGFSGEASAMHYLTRFTEDLLPPETQTAEQPKQKAKPATPPTASAPRNRAPVARPAEGPRNTLRRK